MKFEVYADTGGHYRWRLLSGSNKVAASGESFASKLNAERAATGFNTGAKSASYELPVGEPLGTGTPRLVTERRSVRGASRSSRRTTQRAPPTTCGTTLAAPRDRRRSTAEPR
jgi:uncharacterized protein YegP (UPF0339 family)